MNYHINENKLQNCEDRIVIFFDETVKTKIDKNQLIIYTTLGTLSDKDLRVLIRESQKIESSIKFEFDRIVLHF